MIQSHYTETLTHSLSLLPVLNEKGNMYRKREIGWPLYIYKKYRKRATFTKFVNYMLNKTTTTKNNLN